MKPSHRPRLPPARTAWLLVVIGAAAFVTAAFLVHSGANTLDERLFRAINDVPAALAAVLTPLSRLFLPFGLLVAIGVAAVFVTTWNRSILPVLAGVAAAGTAWFLANLAKAVAQRPRPYEVIADAVLRQPPAHHTSFPSSHAATTVATVIALLPFLPRSLAGWAIAYAALVGWSRIYLGVHYPLDVIAGAGVGLVVGGLTLVVVRART
jgi:undecaprenyl-diphosphatase